MNRGVMTGAVAIGLACLLVLGCSQKMEIPKAGKPRVTTLTIKAQNIPMALEYVAQTASSRQVNINARVNGFLQKRLYQEGSMVRDGQTLFQIDPRPFQVQVNEAKAALDSSKAAHATAKANLDRIKPLVALNALSKKDLDNAKGQFLTTQAAVHQAQAQLNAARLNLSYTTIKSPVDGLAGSASVAEGTYVDATNNQLTTVYKMSPMWVNFSISENRLLELQKQIQAGQLIVPANDNFTVEVILPDGSVLPNTGKLVFSAPDYNPTTGTNMIRASVDNPKGTLKPNQFVRVRMTGATRPDAIAVPQKAVQQGSKGHFVWVIKDNKAQYRPVTVGDQTGMNWVITQGLQNGEQVVVDGVQTLAAGADVEVSQNTQQQEIGASSTDEKAANEQQPAAADAGTVAASKENGTDNTAKPEPAKP
ncbi:efflux RND transporter periplasmic adaptor subunit [Oxalobacter formigenes]|nr:efflux RND transporter periplasmic adaptor subunit [Oxalobacter formigenes]ARQ45948.1 Toluene efflux pump periplasmic linker protein TtgA [Oxalobacter formigenes]MCZ4062143.1 efflux RND transporter periplasmic adaptor subunit [Oxalobacter formigenes]WAW00517.1 efflux RND transporter periplasmic adaptor subunit [Oxalobacter formigenes]WAW02847.1 efflux RND transporter periplasmic adaptor subunit [Oxalobacter formigenes]WAW06723.1 efflux RND transporter periplasmic adaptor subunit [Oxalobacte